MQKYYQECNDVVIPVLRQSRWAAEFRTVCTPSWSGAAVPALLGWCTAGWGSPWGRGSVRSDSSRQCSPGGCWWRRSPLWGRHRSGRSHGWPDQVLYGINQKQSICAWNTLIPRLLPSILLPYCTQEMGREPGMFHHVHNDKLCVWINLRRVLNKQSVAHTPCLQPCFVNRRMQFSMTARSPWKAHPPLPLHHFSYNYCRFGVQFSHHPTSSFVNTNQGQLVGFDKVVSRYWWSENCQNGSGKLPHTRVYQKTHFFS